MAINEDQEFQKQVGRIGDLIRDIEGYPDAEVQSTVRELVQSLLSLHGAGLDRMLYIANRAGGSGQAIIDDLLRDELVSSLLLLHDLHPLDLKTRITGALDKVRPYLSSHGGNVELLEVTPEGVVRLRLEGSCKGCPSSRVTLKYAIEEAIYKAAPDVAAIEAEGAVDARPAPPQGFVPLSQIGGAKKPRDGWVRVDGIESLGEGTVTTEDVAGTAVLFCKLDDTVYAYGNHCPHCRQLLKPGPLTANGLACAGCGHNFDVRRAGRDLDEPELHLEPYPLLHEPGGIKVALHAMA